MFSGQNVHTCTFPVQEITDVSVFHLQRCLFSVSFLSAQTQLHFLLQDVHYFVHHVFRQHNWVYDSLDLKQRCKCWCKRELIESVNASDDSNHVKFVATPKATEFVNVRKKLSQKKENPPPTHTQGSVAIRPQKRLGGEGTLGHVRRFGQQQNKRKTVMRLQMRDAW